MKKVISLILVALFISASLVSVVAAEKIVGEIKSIKVTLADEKSGADKTITCGDGGEKCKIKKGSLKPGNKVTVEPKGGKLVIRKAVAGC